ncbi:MAG: ABC transporter substrate-binding protein [Verrucomicrobiota bacterium]
MKPYRLLLPRFVAVLFLLLSGAVGLAQTPANAPLRVGVTVSFAPMVYKEGGKVVGAEVDFATALGQELGRPVKLVEVAWVDQIQSLVDGKIDIIMSSMSVTPARALRVSFTESYLTVGQVALVRREDANKYIMGFPIMPNGTIGVLKATTGDFLAQQEFGRCKRKDFKVPQDAAKALVKKKIDLFISDSPVVSWQASMNEAQGLVVVPIFLTEERLAWAVRKSDAALLASVNQALGKLQADGRAAAIIKHWLPYYK